jgi:serine/threonine protein kinase
MEAYTLWWNGGNFKELLHLNEKVVSHAEWHEIKLVKQLTGQQQKEISLFRRHKAKLAWALVYVTSLVHNAGVLHNDLSLVNILLHYPPFSDEEINIGICDWGIASRIQEGAPSHFGYEKQEKLDAERMGRWWAAPELFYLFGPEGSDTSLDVMKATYKYSVKSDSYSIGKLTQRMNIEHMVEYDKDLFRNHESSRYFAMKLRELVDVDVNKRPTCAQVVDLLMGKPWFMKPPEFVFRDSVLS